MKPRLIITILFAMVVIIAALFYVVTAPSRQIADANSTNLTDKSGVTGVATGNVVANETNGAGDDVFGGESEDDYIKVVDVSDPGAYTFGINTIVLGPEPEVEIPAEEPETQNETADSNGTAENETA